MNENHAPATLATSGATGHIEYRPPVARDSVCEGTSARHCWHGTGIVLTSYPGYAVERCCWCGATSHRSLAAAAPGRWDHGPYQPR